MMTKIIQIDDSLRLVPYFLADHHDAALGWYQDVNIGNPTYQHQGLGRKVLKALIDLARQKGWRNESSRNL